MIVLSKLIKIGKNELENGYVLDPKSGRECHYKILINPIKSDRLEASDSRDFIYRTRVWKRAFS
ncbi:MAG: DUF2147 domain-containing protein [Flavobacteriaceae bacterium]|nr:DUF2147 domain-containing protein [Muriicola sp.]NNC62662.1 DUF2147 domain-containing protein [Eudoraea sp.]NNK21573.1 DUF2147 domain-containing protein [Flavobacteriaceae bacterium]MBT8289651.1 DUF2147 domain-containing protein [Muriicola sp.]NNK34842.1 DUF2147 domain-containing protein [Eudoraea sp.]